ncbi:MAG: hypothetical protein CME48_07365 [Halieaceae bacterium]|nr:hypothetical protein [Halieaceae bacterium]
MIQIQVSAGELLDKITILEIKNERISDPKKLTNVRKELVSLEAENPFDLNNWTELSALLEELRMVNRNLWDIEDQIRSCENISDFGDTFVQLARSVYIQNDARADIKKRINILTKSNLTEEKSYTPYQ